MFVYQAKEEKEEVVFKRDNREMIYTIKKVERAFSDDQFKLQELQTLFRCFKNALQW